MRNLDEVRSEIDQLDSALLDLFEKRCNLAADVAAYKKAHGLPVFDPAREREKLWKASCAAPEHLKTHALAFTQLLMEASRSQQHLMLQDTAETPKILEDISNPERYALSKLPLHARVACQGMEGSYSSQAASCMFAALDIQFYPSFQNVFQAVAKGKVDYGIVPLENSAAGSVNQVFELFSTIPCSIVRTKRLKIDHALIGLPGTHISDIQEVYSHQQALDQSSDFIAIHNLKAHACANTAQAADLVARQADPTKAALADEACARLYGLEVLERCIQNRANNYTRFALIAATPQMLPGSDRTSLMVILNHQAGSLYHLLGKFFAYHVNILKLESRPIPERDFDFMFYFDIQMSAEDPQFIPLIQSLSLYCQEIRWLGSYGEVAS